MSCIFCKIVERHIPSHVVYEDEATLAFMDINPGTRGHVLVIPKQHAADIFEVRPEDLAAVTHTGQRVALAVRQALGCDGVNLVQSNGAAAFQSVFHLHLHVIPRYVGDDVRLPWIPKRAEAAELTSTAEKLREALRS